jgi:tetratricopeptide (TPR) repeat protein
MATLRWRVPAPYEHLAGRGPALTEMAASLAQEPLLVLAGMPGIGKTQLAATLLAGDGAEVLAWIRGVDAGLTEDARSLALELGSAEVTPEDPLAVLCDHLARRASWAIVLDAVDEPVPVRRLLGLAGPGRRIIITTTNRGWFEPGDVRAIKAVSHEDAHLFLLERTGETGPEAHEAAHDLASKLLGVPLALRQCEGWVRAGDSSLARYRELFDSRAQEMLRAGPGPLDHNDTVAVTFDLALAAAEKASPGARELLRTLAFLASDPFPREWVTAEDAVAIEHQLRALTNVSLVELAPQEIRVHGLVSEVMRGTSLPEARTAALGRARALFSEHLPQAALEPSNWPVYGLVVSHLETLVGHLVSSAVTGSETVRLIDRLASFHEAQGRLGRAWQLFEEAEPIAATLEPLDPARDQFEGNLVALLAKMDPSAGIPRLEDLIARRRLREPVNPLSLADALNNLGLAVSGRDPARSANLMVEAVTLYARLFPEAEWGNHQEVVHALINQGLTLWRSGEHASAEQAWLKVLEISENANVDRRAEVATALGNLGVLYDNRGDGRRAADCSRRGYDLTVHLVGEHHPDAVWRLVNFGGALRVLSETNGREHLERALELHRLAETQARELEPPPPAHIAHAANNQGVDLLQLDRPEEAIGPLERALTIRREIAGGESESDVAQTTSNLAKALLQSGRLNDAEVRYREVLGICDAMGLADEHDRRALAWDGLGEIALARGDHERAAYMFKRSFRAFPSVGGEPSPRARRAKEKWDAAERASDAQGEGVGAGEEDQGGNG